MIRTITEWDVVCDVMCVDICMSVRGYKNRQTNRHSMDRMEICIDERVDRCNQRQTSFDPAKGTQLHKA